MFVTLEEMARNRSPRDLFEESYRNLIREKDYIVSRIGLESYERILADATQRLGDRCEGDDSKNASPSPENSNVLIVHRVP